MNDHSLITPGQNKPVLCLQTNDIESGSKSTNIIPTVQNTLTLNNTLDSGSLPPQWKFKGKKTGFTNSTNNTALMLNRESSTETNKTSNSRTTSIRVPSFIETNSRGGTEGFGSLQFGGISSGAGNPITSVPEDFRKLVLENKDFILPTLPTGQNIKIELFSNWGDCNHIG